LFGLVSKKLIALAIATAAIGATFSLTLPVQQDSVTYQPTIFTEKTALPVTATIGPNQTLQVSFDHIQDRKDSFDFSYFENVTLDCKTHELVREEQPTVMITDSKNQTVREMDRFYFYLGCPKYPEMDKLETMVEFFGLAIIMTSQPNGTYNAVMHNPKDKEMHIIYKIDLAFDELNTKN